MRKTYSETRIEVWHENYINYPLNRQREDEDLVVVQAEHSVDDLYLVEVGTRRDIAASEVLM